MILLFRLIACSLLAPSARNRADLRHVGPAQESDKLLLLTPKESGCYSFFSDFCADGAVFLRRCPPASNVTSSLKRDSPPIA
jgi:hypothetical protein